MSKKGKVLYGEVLAGFISETDEGYEFVYDNDYHDRLVNLGGLLSAIGIFNRE
ncbi:MAG: hypothetical protein Q8L07_08750 [Sediminibacterium sp.]|nr:hypothetical protein [Sediminibacterium sp.]